MSSVECLREFVNERLTAAAEEIFGVFQKTIVEYEEEIYRQRKLLDIVWKPEIKLHRIDLQQQHVCEETEEEVLTDQQLCNQERSSGLDQEDPEPLQIKEEQEELCTSQEGEEVVLKVEADPFVGEEVVLKVEADTFVVTPTDEDMDHVKPEPESDHQLLLNNFYAAESQDQKGYKHEDSTRDAESEQNNQQYEHESTSNIVSNPDMSEIDGNTHKDLQQQHVCEETEEEVLTDQQLCNQERSSILDQEDPEPLQIKDEQGELCTSQEGEEVVLTVDAATCTVTPTDEERDHVKPEPESDHQLPLNNFSAAESQDQKEYKHEDSTRDAESEQNNQQYENKSNSNIVYNPDMSEIGNTHKGKHSFKCDNCGKAFKHKSSLYKHARIHTDEKLYICDTCSKRFAKMETLRRHQRIHTGEKPYICTTCGKGFTQNGTLKVHIRQIHTGEKPYLCNTCGKRFSDMSALKMHQRIHTGEKPYICTTCGKAFTKSSNLKVHIRGTHTDERPYLCNTCGKRFAVLARLKKHAGTHTGERPYTATCVRKDTPTQNTRNGK